MRSWNVVNATRAESCFPFLFSFFFWNRPLNGQRRGLLHRNRIDRVLFAVSSATITSALPALSCGIKEPIHFGRMRPPAPSDPAIAHVESIKTRSTEKTEEPPWLVVVRLFRKQAAGGTKSNSGTRSRIPPRFSTRPAAVFRCCFVDGFFFFVGFGWPNTAVVVVCAKNVLRGFQDFRYCRSSECSLKGEFRYIFVGVGIERILSNRH